MRYASALAFLWAAGLAAAWAAPAASAPLCDSGRIRPGARNVTLNTGDTSIVKVTGYAAKPKSSAAPADIVLHVKPGVAYELTAQAAKEGQPTTVRFPSNLTVNIVSDPKPSASPSAGSSASPSPSASPGPPPGTHPGGPGDKLTATIADERFASFTASPAPVPSSGPGSVDAEPVSPSVDYTIKGQHPGDTALVVAQGDECVAIGVHVRPSVTDRFLATAGVGTSSVPKYTVSTVTSASGFPPGSSGTAMRVLKTENSDHQVSVPLLFNYRLTDNPNHNLYGTVGFFTNSGSGGLVYGVSLGREQYLLTLGLHSDNVTDLAPGLRNNDIVPAGITTSVTRRVTRGFFALTFPTSFLTQLLSPGSTTAKSSSGSSNTNSGSESH